MIRLSRVVKINKDVFDWDNTKMAAASGSNKRVKLMNFTQTRIVLESGRDTSYFLVQANEGVVCKPTILKRKKKGTNVGKWSYGTQRESGCSPRPRRLNKASCVASWWKVSTALSLVHPYLWLFLSELRQTRQTSDILEGYFKHKAHRYCFKSSYL